MKTTLALALLLTATLTVTAAERPKRPTKTVPRIKEAAGVFFKPREVTTSDAAVTDPQPDEFLFLPVRKGETWHFKFVVYFHAADTSYDWQEMRFQCGLTFPQGLPVHGPYGPQGSSVRYTMRYQYRSVAGATSSVPLTGDNVFNQLDCDINPHFPAFVEFEGVLLNSPSDGKIQFHWGRSFNAELPITNDPAEVHGASYILANKK